MCWPHTYRNINKHLTALRTEDSVLADRVMADIEELQWSSHDESTFRLAYKLLEDKYLKANYDEKKHEHLVDFFSYFRCQWVDSPVFRWYEGANPWSISNNQGIEGQNKQIKAAHTFKRRCPLGTFFTIVERMVEDFSKQDDKILFSGRINMLEDPEFREGLKLKTEGYQWLKTMKVGSGDKILCIQKGKKYTVSESLEFQLGKVDQIWAVTSSSNSLTELSLKDRAKLRIKMRETLSMASFDEYKAMRNSCWLLEERDGDFFCDCPIGSKGKLCKHTVGMHYRQGFIEVTSQVRSVPLGQKRKRGRPKNLPNCLAKSPPVSAPNLSAVSSPTSPPAPLPQDKPATPPGTSQLSCPPASPPASSPGVALLSPLPQAKPTSRGKRKMTVQNVGVTTRKRRKIQEVNGHAELQSPDKLSAGLTNQTLPKKKARGRGSK